MQNNTDSMNKTKEIPGVRANENVQEQEVRTDVHEDQQSLFDAENAFSESILVEKDIVEINSSETKEKAAHNSGDTAVFDLPEKNTEEKDVSVKELQDSAKDYYDATHSDSIEEKVNELCKLADKGFGEDETEGFVVEKSEVVIDEKKKKKDRKLRRRGVILDDDMEMLSGGLVSTAVSEEQAFEDVKTWNPNQENETDTDEPVLSEEQGVEHKNPLGIYDETDNENEEESEEDKLIKALGGSKKHFKTFEAVFGDDEPEVEYTDRNQEATILKDLRKGAILSAVSVVLTFIATAICFYFEFAAGTKLAHPAFFEAGKFGVTYSMSMLQIMFICVIFNLDGMRRAFKGLRPAKPSAEGFCAAAVVVCTLHSVLSAILVSHSTELKSFCSVGCLSLLFLSVNSFIKAHTSLTAFCFAASKAPKYSSVDLDVASGEAKAFEKYLDKETSLFTVGKSDFVDGFFKKCMSVPKASKNTLKLVLLGLFVAIVTGVVCGVIKGAYSGVCTFTVVCLASFPANALISTALPFFAASSKAKKTQTAYIGEAACDVYESAGVISFDDTEVFPAKSVKVSSIRTYGDNRIDKVILYMARIFDKVEGPLSFVFANSVQSLEDRDMDVQISEHFSDGISAKVDTREVLVGTDNFMRLYDVETPLDNIDESFTRSLGSIMYMAVDGKLAAKFYIKYTMSRNFEPILRAFYDAGICVGIKTHDPCITNEIVCGNLKGSNYPVSVIKKHDEKQENDGIAKSTEGAIISLSGTHNFLKGFIRLDNLRNVYRSNTIISIFSAIAGALLSAFMSVTGFFGMGIVTLIAFQLVWCIPTVLFSLLSKK